MSIAKVHETFSYTVAGGSTTKTITIPAPGAGNMLVLMVQQISAGSTVTAVTGGGVTWTKVLGANGGSSGSRLELWVGPNSSGAGTTVSVTVSATYSRFDCCVTEWSGMPATLAADGGSSQSSNDPNPVTPAVTPTAGLPVLLLALSSSYNTTYTAGPTGGFTPLSTTGGSGYAAFAYQIAAAASGSYQAGWTASRGYGTNITALYAYDGTSGGGTGGGDYAYFVVD